MVLAESGHSLIYKEQGLEKMDMKSLLKSKPVKPAAEIMGSSTAIASEADSVYPEHFRVRDKFQRKKNSQAKWAFWLPLGVAIAALVITCLSYRQDQNNNASDAERWAKFTTVVERENQTLQDRVKSLEVKITDMEKTKRSAAVAR